MKLHTATQSVVDNVKWGLSTAYRSLPKAFNRANVTKAIAGLAALGLAIRLGKGLANNLKRERTVEVLNGSEKESTPAQEFSVLHLRRPVPQVEAKTNLKEELTSRAVISSERRPSTKARHTFSQPVPALAPVQQQTVRKTNKFAQDFNNFFKSKLPAFTKKAANQLKREFKEFGNDVIKGLENANLGAKGKSR